jgi:hypothetical protein
VLKGILDALGIVAATSPLVPPAHPRTAARLDILDVPPGVQLVECGFRTISYTDSGGIRTPIPAFSYTPRN